MKQYDNDDWTYKGDSISFLEMPYGCEIVQNYKPDMTIIIGSLKDAIALRDSLNKMIVIWSDDEEDKDG